MANEHAVSREARSGKATRARCVSAWREHMEGFATATLRGDVAEAQRHHDLAGDWAEAAQGAN